MGYKQLVQDCLPKSWELRVGSWIELTCHGNESCGHENRANDRCAPAHNGGAVNGVAGAGGTHELRLRCHS